MGVAYIMISRHVSAYKFLINALPPQIPPPTLDEFGRTVSSEFRDPWEGRVGVAKGFSQVIRHLSTDEALSLLKYIIPGGIYDRSEHVRGTMTEAAKEAITEHGEVGVVT